MSKFKVVNLIDKLFITFSIFLIVYAWINFFIRDLWTTFFLSLIFSSSCVFLLFHWINKRNSKKSANKEYLKDVEEKFLAFKLMPQNERIKFIKSILQNTCECQNVDNGLVFNSNNKICQILVALTQEKLTQFALENLISMKEPNVEVLKIVCCETDTNLSTKILKNLEIEIITKKKLYDEFFLPNNTFPDCSNLNTNKERKKFKEIMKNFFIPSKAKSYFLCGLILIFLSIIIPYHTYYLIFGSVLLIFSVACKLQPIFIR